MGFFSVIIFLAATSAVSAPIPAASPTIDAVGERYYKSAREAWRTRVDPPYIRYGARIKYEHHFHTFIDWWDAYTRTSDDKLSVVRIHDPEDENRRLAGAPINLFFVTVADTNPIAEKIAVDDPVVPPTFSFGLRSKEATLDPVAQASGLRQITVVSTVDRTYDVRYVGTTNIDSIDAIHLTFEALRNPKVNRLRDLWIDPTTSRTMQVRVQGLLDGKPYDGITWLAHYVVVEDGNYLQSIVAEEPMHFGVNTYVPNFEFDYFDYHFPKTVPQFTFESKSFFDGPLHSKVYTNTPGG